MVETFIRLRDKINSRPGTGLSMIVGDGTRKAYFNIYKDGSLLLDDKYEMYGQKLIFSVYIYINYDEVFINDISFKIPDLSRKTALEIILPKCAIELWKTYGNTKFTTKGRQESEEYQLITDILEFIEEDAQR